jgi:hypothetical protein
VFLLAARTQEAARQAKTEVVARYRTRVLDVEKKVLESAEEARLARFASEYRGKTSADSGGTGSKMAGEGLGLEPAARREISEEGFEEGLKERGFTEGSEEIMGGRSQRKGNDGPESANGGSNSETGLVSTSETAEERRTGAVTEQSVTDKAQKGRRDGRVADRLYSRSRSRKKERLEGSIEGRRVSLGRGILEGEETTLQATNAATDLIERAGRVSLGTSHSVPCALKAPPMLTMLLSFIFGFLFHIL